MNTTRRRGVATLVALLLLAIVAVALAAVAARITHDIRRTRLLQQDAQLRQLLLAGASAALQQAEAPPPGAVRIDLPPAMDASLTLSFAGEQPDRRNVQIEARFEGRRQSQQLLLQKRESRWAVAEAHLGGS